MPLFPSYVFIRASDGERRRALQAPGVLRFVRNQEGPVHVEESELDAVRRLLQSGLAYDPLPDVQPGEEVEIVTGALRGCRGHLLSKSGNAVVLLVSAIQAGVRVSLPDPSWVRCVGKHTVKPGKIGFVPSAATAPRAASTAKRALPLPPVCLDRPPMGMPAALCDTSHGEARTQG